MDQFNHNLASASLQEAEAPLKALLKAFPMADRDDMRGLIGTYLIAIEGYSLVAIQKSVARFIRGEVLDHDPRFAPTPAQFSRDVRYRQDLMTPPEPARQALPAPIRAEPTPEERQRVADRARAWVAEREVEANAKRFAPRSPEEIAAELGGLKLSPEALRTCVPDPAEQFDEWDSSTPNQRGQAA